MSYTALYRKYRPRTFEDVKGQDHIVTTLENEIRTGRIGHAYLFCGTRGTGKTTVAKIFARAVNCTEVGSPDPCGECESCRAIEAGSSVNVIEIDAASNNGVDNIRRIRDDIRYSPAQGKYIVYIIDEVHMLSSGAFNALLKTLEEPPSYVIFILATTEAHKIPVTILSRCQRYDFRRISASTIKARLKEILSAEGTEAGERALDYIAMKADGSMRDALSILDQCISFFPGKELEYDDVLELLGSADISVMSRLLACLIKKDAAGSISVVEEMLGGGAEPGQLASDFVWYMRNVLLIKSSDELASVIDLSSENIALIKKDAMAAGVEDLSLYIRRFSELMSRMRQSPQKRVLLEIEVIALCSAHEDAAVGRDVYGAGPVASHGAMRGGAEGRERGNAVDDGSAHVQQTGAGKAPGQTVADEEQEKKLFIKWANAGEIHEIAKSWGEIIKNTDGALRAYLARSTPSVENGRLAIIFADKPIISGGEGDRTNPGEIISENTRERIYAAMEKVCGRRAQFDARLKNGNADNVIDVRELVGGDLMVVINE